MYGYSSGGRDIHHAITFLMDATEDQSLIAGYAAEDTGASFRGFSPTNQKVDWVQTNAASWGHYYLKRFSGTPIADRLEGMSIFLQAGRAESDAPSGGVARCLA